MGFTYLTLAGVPHTSMALAHAILAGFSSSGKALGERSGHEKEREANGHGVQDEIRSHGDQSVTSQEL